MYRNASELLEVTKRLDCNIWEVVLKNEIKTSDRTADAIRSQMLETFRVMQNSASFAQDNDIRSISGLIGGDAKKVNEYRKTNKTICGDSVNIAISRALSSSEVNASMGRIVAAPTAGSCGILPAAIITAGEKITASDDQLVNALLTASGIGQIIAKNATLSGAEGGCQAECGSASAMAAAALVEMYGGTPDAALHAAAIAISNILGLVCDPVAGLVEVPCANRNAMGVVNAMLCADMALAGVTSIIPFDEMIEAMYKVGRLMPVAFKETALGGVATTPTALRLKSEIFNK